MTGVMAASTTVLGVWFLGFGLWEHDWRILAGAVILMVVGPLVAEDARITREGRRQRERLDRLWDDDPSDSA